MNVAKTAITNTCGTGACESCRRPAVTVYETSVACESSGAGEGEVLTERVWSDSAS